MLIHPLLTSNMLKNKTYLFFYHYDSLIVRFEQGEIISTCALDLNNNLYLEKVLNTKKSKLMSRQSAIKQSLSSEY